MALYDLNDLFNGLQSARGRAQQRSDRRQQGLLEQLIEIGRDGEPKSLCWVSRLPSGDGHHRTHELLRLPWSSLRSAAPEYVTTASIAFDCRIPTEKPASGSLTLIPARRRTDRSAPTHRLEIKLGPGDEDLDEIRLDGRRLKTAESDEIHIPPELFEQLSAHKHRRNKFAVWKLLMMLGLIGLLAAGVLWFLGILPRP